MVKIKKNAGETLKYFSLVWAFKAIMKNALTCNALTFNLTSMEGMYYDSGYWKGEILRAKEGWAMKRLRQYFGIWLPVLCLLSFSAPCLAEEPKKPTPISQASEKKFSQTVKEKYQEEMEAVKKDTTQAGKEVKESYTELPGKAGEEFKKTGTALKDAGKEMKEGAVGAWQSIKNLFQKK
jgi:hypothetical protein